jgi:hypothetical protein
VIHAFSFYLPTHLWASIDEKLLENLLVGIAKFEVDLKKTMIRKKTILRFLLEHKSDCEGHFCMYVIYRITCVATLTINMLFLNWYLDGMFWRYGFDAMFSTEFANGFSIMDKLFPLSANCDLKVYGPSGDIVNYGAVCELPVNDIYRMVYIIIWLVITIRNPY